MVRQRPPEPREKLLTGRAWLDTTLGVLLVLAILASPFVQMMLRPDDGEQVPLLVILAIAGTAMTIRYGRQRGYVCFVRGGMLGVKGIATLVLLAVSGAMIPCMVSPALILALPVLLLCLCGIYRLWADPKKDDPKR